MKGVVKCEYIYETCGAIIKHIARKPRLLPRDSSSVGQLVYIQNCGGVQGQTLLSSSVEQLVYFRT